MQEPTRVFSTNEGTHGFGCIRAASRKRLFAALIILGTLFLVEAAGGYLTNSLALLADAGHLLTDLGAIALALIGMWFADRPASMTRSYGYYRMEVFAALTNGLTLWTVAGYIVFRAIQRIQSPPEVESLPVLLVAIVGVVIQVVAMRVLRGSSENSLNVKAVYIHVVTDALQSVAVVVSGVLMLVFGWYVADPLVSIGIAAFIFWSGSLVAWEAVQVFMENSPGHVDVNALCVRLEGVVGVTGVHDIHTWSITTGYEVLSAHVTTDVSGTSARKYLLQRLQEIVYQEFGIAHATIQLETSSAGCAETHHLAHISQ